MNFVRIINLLTQSSENTDRLRNGPRRDSFSISFPSAFDNGDGIHRSVKVTIYVEIPQADHICEKINHAKNFTGQGVPLSLVGGGGFEIHHGSKSLFSFPTLPRPPKALNVP